MHKKYIEAAYKEALKAQKKDEVPVGAIIVHNEKIIARAHNSREKKQTVLGHAELNAIQKASKKLGTWRLQDCDLYVTLEPCPMCAGAIQQARICNVYYAASDPKAGVVSLDINLHQNPQLNHRYALTHLGDPRCGKILSDFFAKKRAQKK